MVFSKQPKEIVEAIFSCSTSLVLRITSGTTLLQMKGKASVKSKTLKFIEIRTFSSTLFL